MEIVERYLQAVKLWLPDDQRDDILAELREDLVAQVEEKTEALGRSPDDGELGELLTARGRPLLVASRYFPQRQLIGPLLYPAYVFVLKVTALCVLAPWIAVRAAAIVLVAPASTAGSWLGAAMDLVSFGCFAWAAVTLVFVGMERLLTQSDLLRRWGPRELPPVRERGFIPRAVSAFELVVELGIGVLVPVWLLVSAPAGVFHIGDLEIGLSPVWTTLFWSAALLSLACAALAGVNLARPWRTAPRALARAACNAGIGLLSWRVMESGLLAHIASPAIAPNRAAEIVAAINLWLERIAPLALAVLGVVLAIDLYRVWRVSTARTGGAAGTGKWSAGAALKSL